ncbi:hypothetical protein CUZ96_1477 [Enterococcus lactis]|nr:hypothetical protein [Enterococcus lactis]MBL5011813.1 hypothetical protein [Enterococcus lactis]
MIRVIAVFLFNGEGGYGLLNNQRIVLLEGELYKKGRKK